MSKDAMPFGCCPEIQCSSPIPLFKRTNDVEAEIPSPSTLLVRSMVRKALRKEYLNGTNLFRKNGDPQFLVLGDPSFEELVSQFSDEIINKLKYKAETESMFRHQGDRITKSETQVGYV